MPRTMHRTLKLQRLWAKESTVGVLLLACALLSVLLANSSIGDSYRQLWNHPVGERPLSHWIDDGLMALFFLLVGLELKQEFFYGTLGTRKQALVPLSAAVGGMLVPAAIFLLFNAGTNSWVGFGIPMATDIAFVMAVVVLLGRRVPGSLKVFLTTLAVVDDLGAVLVIALFYSSSISIPYLLLAVAVWGLLIFMGQNSYPRRYSEVVMLTVLFIVGGIGMWILMMHSGVHATLSGIMLAVAIPSFDNHPKAPASRRSATASGANQWRQRLHRPVYWIVLPLFILANTAIPFDSFKGGMDDAALMGGIGAGLLLGKPLGILLGTGVAFLIGGKGPWANISTQQWLGAACLGGIGFTMAIFVTTLAFEIPVQIDNAKVAILTASGISALLGASLIAFTHAKVPDNP